MQRLSLFLSACLSFSCTLSAYANLFGAIIAAFACCYLDIFVAWRKKMIPLPFVMQPASLSLPLPPAPPLLAPSLAAFLQECALELCVKHAI